MKHGAAVLQVDDLDAAMGMLTPFAAEQWEEGTVLNPFDERMQAQLLRQLEPAPEQVHSETSLQHSTSQGFLLVAHLRLLQASPPWD